jgi:glucuronate isomerase
MALLIAILSYYHDKLRQDPTWRAQVVIDYKPDLFTGEFKE